MKNIYTTWYTWENRIKLQTKSKKTDWQNNNIQSWQTKLHYNHIPRQISQKKVIDFISNNNFTIVKSELAKKFQRELRSKIGECQLIVHKNSKWKYINLNPTAPTIIGLIKIHKTNSPIRLVVKWQNAPVYKLAKMLSKKLQAHIPLPYTFNITNSIQLINDLLEIPYHQNLCFT